MKSKEFIEKHIDKLINNFTFAKQKKDVAKCPCYKEGKPCHNINEEELNCFLCFCPEYNTSKIEGGCKLNSKKGKWFFNDALEKGKIWDCSDCDYPHRKENIKKYLRKNCELDK